MKAIIRKERLALIYGSESREIDITQQFRHVAQ